MWTRKRIPNISDVEEERYDIAKSDKQYTAYLRRNWFYPYLRVFAILGIVLCPLPVYIISFHRIKSVEDMMALYSTWKLPLVDDRCRQYNQSHFQCLPNVFFIGASKCGTTSITEMLTRHPRVHFVNRRIHKVDHHREVHRFDRNTFHRSIRALELMDEWASGPIVESKSDAVVHYTPHYLYAPTVPFDLREFFTDSHAMKLKFIVILRNPIRRALSSYWFQNSRIFYPSDRGSYAELSDQCKQEFSQRREYDACIHNQHKRAGTHTNGSTASRQRLLRAQLETCFGATLRSTSLGGRHVDKGVYVDQLDRWFSNFPRENFFLTSLEEWTAEPVKEFTRMLNFIGVESDATTASLARNSSLSRLVRPNSLQAEPPPDLVAALKDFYAPHQERLAALLGNDMPAMN